MSCAACLPTPAVLQIWWVRWSAGLEPWLMSIGGPFDRWVWLSHCHFWSWRLNVINICYFMIPSVNYSYWSFSVMLLIRQFRNSVFLAWKRKTSPWMLPISAQSPNQNVSDLVNRAPASHWKESFGMKQKTVCESIYYKGCSRASL